MSIGRYSKLCYLLSPFLLFVNNIKRHLPLFIQAYFPIQKKHFACQEKPIRFFSKKEKSCKHIFEILLFTKNRKL